MSNDDLAIKNEELVVQQKTYKLEKYKVFVSVLTPLILVALTFVVNNAIQERGALLKHEEQILLEKQRIYSKKLGQGLNTIYIYIADIGDFRKYTPADIVDSKRDCDRQFFMYRYYWSNETEESYNAFIDAAFTTRTGDGRPAKINTRKEQKAAAFVFDKRAWDPSWDDWFAEDKYDNTIKDKYYRLMDKLVSDTVDAQVHPLAERLITH